MVSLGFEPIREIIRQMTGGAEPKRHVREQYDHLAEHYEDRWLRYVEASNEQTLSRLHLRPGERLLDIGCGTGRLLAGAPGDVRPVGVDLSLAMTAIARRRMGCQAHLLVGDAEQLPFASGSFDVIVSSSSFHYWPSPGAALSEIARLLRPSGRLIITDWCDDYLACKVCDRFLRWLDPGHQHIYTEAACRNLLHEAGYTAISVERYRISWMWGLMTAVARLSQ